MIELISKFFISYKNNLKTVGSPLGGKGFNTHASTLVLTVTGGSTDLDMDIVLLPVSVVDSLSLLEGNCTRDSPHSICLARFLVKSDCGNPAESLNLSTAACNFPVIVAHSFAIRS